MINLSELRLGQRFILHGRHYEITYSNDSVIEYCDSTSGSSKSMYCDYFSSLVKEASIEFPDLELIQSKEPLFLSKEDIEQRDRKLEYVRTLLKKTTSPCSKKHALPIIKLIAEQRNEKAPGFSTVGKWVKKYVNSGYNPMSLVSQHYLKGNSTKQVDPSVEMAIDKLLNDFYLTDQRPTISATYDKLSKLVEEGEITGIPKKRTLERRVANLSTYAKLRKRHGSLAASRELKPAGESIHYDRVLEAVQADGHVLDVLVVCKYTGVILGRPYMTAIMDVYSRGIIGIVISLKPFCAATLLRATKDALTGGYSGLGGQIENFHVDNGPDYVCKSFKNLGARVGFNIHYAPPNSPNSKAHIERFFRTLNTALVHKLKGTVWSSPTERGRYPSERYACFTLDDIETFIHKWITEVYHKSIHQGTSRAPLALWNESYDEHQIYRYDKSYVHKQACIVEQRSINKGRVHLHGLKWKSPALSILAQKLKNSSLPRKVNVHLDTSDLSEVTVTTADNPNDFIIAKSTEPHYTENLTLDEHTFFQQELKRQTGNDLNEFPVEELIRLKEQLYNYIDDVTDAKAKEQAIKSQKSLQKRFKRQQAESSAPPPKTLKAVPKREAKLHLDFAPLDIEEMD